MNLKYSKLLKLIAPIAFGGLLMAAPIITLTSCAKDTSNNDNNKETDGNDEEKYENCIFRNFDDYDGYLSSHPVNMTTPFCFGTEATPESYNAIRNSVNVQFVRNSVLSWLEFMFEEEYVEMHLNETENGVDLKFNITPSSWTQYFIDVNFTDNEIKLESNVEFQNGQSSNGSITYKFVSTGEKNANLCKNDDKRLLISNGFVCEGYVVEPFFDAICSFYGGGIPISPYDWTNATFSY